MSCRPGLSFMTNCTVISLCSAVNQIKPGIRSSEVTHRLNSFHPFLQAELTLSLAKSDIISVVTCSHPRFTSLSLRRDGPAACFAVEPGARLLSCPLSSLIRFTACVLLSFCTCGLQSGQPVVWLSGSARLMPRSEKCCCFLVCLSVMLLN